MSVPPGNSIAYGTSIATSTTTSIYPDNTYIFSTSDLSTVSDTIAVSRSEYEELQADSKLLYALIDEGVEEWEGYDRAVLNV